MRMDAGSLQDQIPFYLTQDQKIALAKALKDFTNHGVGDYYTSQFKHELLQGDGWGSVPIVDYRTQTLRKVRAVVLSNTCDMNNSGTRTTPPQVTVAPIVNMERYKDSLRQRGVDEQKINDKMESIKKQAITNVVHLPAGPDFDESIVQLDMLYTLPVSAFKESSTGNIFTLSMFGFYLFIFKLSVHFCRFHEQIERPVSD